MSIITGKWFEIICIAAVLVCGAQAEEKVLYSEDFETSIPGQLPKLWKIIWGEPKSDILAVSSNVSHSGDNSLMLERTGNPNMWGFGFDIPAMPAGNCRIEFYMMTEGLANQTQFGVEIRNKANHREIVANFGVEKSYACGREKGGELVAGRWYKVQFSLPMTPQDGNEASIIISETDGDMIMEFKSPMKNYPGRRGMQLAINTHPDKSGFKIFLDEVNVILVTK